MIFIAAHISRAYKTLCATVVAKIKITNVDSVYSKCYHFNISCISSNFFFCAFYKQDGMTSVLLLVQGLKTAMPSLDFATCNLLLHVYDI